MKNKTPLNKNASPLKFPVAAVATAIGGLAQVAGGMIGSRRRREEERMAKGQFDKYLAEFESRDTSNPFTNMENIYEDLTVNTQAADFTAQQQAQGMTNTMNQLRGSAGGSGIAALAQAMSNQQSINAQASAASIGQQESANQISQLSMAAQLQQQEKQGELMSRRMEQQKGNTLLGMSQNKLAGATQARQQATNTIMGGLGQMTGGVLNLFGPLTE